MNDPLTTVHPTVTYLGTLDMQICVPEDWTDDDIIQFAERENPSGTYKGWKIRLEGDSKRMPCERRRAGYVHLMLDF